MEFAKEHKMQLALVVPFYRLLFLFVVLSTFPKLYFGKLNPNMFLVIDLFNTIIYYALVFIDIYFYLLLLIFVIINYY